MKSYQKFSPPVIFRRIDESSLQDMHIGPKPSTSCYRCAGALIGGGKGGVDAVTYKSEVADGMRMRVTRLLNMSGKAGRGSGNALAVMGLFFSSAESAMGYLSEDSLPEAANSIAAGTHSGVLRTDG